MSPLSHKLAIFLYKARFYLCTLALILTIFFGYHATKIEFNLSADSIFLEDDPAYIFYRDIYKKQFSQSGSSAFIALASTNKTQDLSLELGKLETKLKQNKYISDILSPLDQKIITPGSRGLRSISSINSQKKLTPQARNYFQNNQLFRNAFLSHSDNSLALIIQLAANTQNPEYQQQAVKNIKYILNNFKKNNPELKIYFTGLSVIQQEMVEILKQDQLKFIPIISALLIFLLLLMTKNLLGAFLPLITIFFALIWTVGFLAISDHEINIINHAIIILIMVIGIADAVHIYTRYIDESIKQRRKNLKILDKKIIITRVIEAMITPCFLTTVTTSLGFLASSAAGVKIIQLFGIDTAVGVGFCFIATFFIMPTLLSLHPIPKSHESRWLDFWPKYLSVDWLLKKSIKKSLKYSNILTLISFLILSSSIFVIPNISGKQTWVGELPKNNPASQALNFLESNFTGVMPFYLVFESTQEYLQSLDNAKIITQITNKLRQHELQPTIRSPYDMINFLLEKNSQLLNIYNIPESQFKILQKNIANKQKTNFFLSKNKNYLTLNGYLKNIDTQKTQDFRNFLQEIKYKYETNKLKIHITGTALISGRALNNIITDMLNSIMLAIIFITLFIALIFRSVKFTFIAILPNILPIITTIAFMKILDINIRLATVMIFSMALGLSIDACLHLLCRIQEETLKTQQNKNIISRLSIIRSIYHAFHGSGRPIIYTTIILVGGFLVMINSEFLALQDFAIISSVILLSALIADIVLLPALLLVTSKTKKSKRD